MLPQTKNIIAFQKGFIYLEDAGQNNAILALTVQAELMKFGYMLTLEATEQVAKASREEIISLHNEVIDLLKDLTGGTRTYKPFYKGFPTEVMQMTECELWVNQIKHYLSDGTWEPAEWTEPFKTTFEFTKYRMISAGTEEMFCRIFTSLCASGQSLTPADLEVIKWFAKTQENLAFPPSIPFKENLCTLAALGLRVPVKTTTDVLRIAVHLSGGDISLPAVPSKTVRQYTRTRYGGRGTISQVTNPERDKFKFRKFKKAERKYILGLLEASNCDVRDMKLKAQRWIRLGEILHPGVYQKEFPKAYKAFTNVREDKIITWYREVEVAFKMNFDTGLAKLSERPSEFFRRLDYLLRARSTKQWDSVLEIFEKLAMSVTNKVLLEVYTHFEGRNTSIQRSIFIKGARKKTVLPTLAPLPQTLIDRIQDTIFQVMKKKFALLEPIGKCWIDPELKKIPLPTNMRSMSESLVPTVRGQRTPFTAGKKVIRPFIHWNDERGNEDLDLHGFLMGKAGTVSFGYNGIHKEEYGCYSGDVRHRRGPCAEYVDIDVAKVLAVGYQYFIMVIHNFEGRSLGSLKECVCGVQEREFPERNMSWLPSSIINAFKPQSAASMSLIGIFDLFSKEYIHLDLDWDTFSTFVHRSEGDALFKAIQPYITLPKVSVYDLMLWHVTGRGELVEKEEAEKLFLYEDFGSSYVKAIEYLGV
jgi:hypothetical protein